MAPPRSGAPTTSSAECCVASARATTGSPWISAVTTRAGCCDAQGGDGIRNPLSRSVTDASTCDGANHGDALHATAMRTAADTVPSTRASSSVPVPAGDGADDLAARIRDPGVTGRAGREAAEVMQDDDGAVLMGDDRVGDGADERGAGTSPAAGPSTPTSANIDASTRAGAGPPTAWTARTALGQALARARSTDRRRSSGPPSQGRRSAGATRSRAGSAPGRARRRWTIFRLSSRGRETAAAQTRAHCEAGDPS